MCMLFCCPIEVIAVRSLRRSIEGSSFEPVPRIASPTQSRVYKRFLTSTVAHPYVDLLSANLILWYDRLYCALLTLQMG